MNTRKVIGIFVFAVSCATVGIVPTIVTIVACAWMIGMVRWVASKVS